MCHLLKKTDDVKIDFV